MIKQITNSNIYIYIYIYIGNSNSSYLIIKSNTTNDINRSKILHSNLLIYHSISNFNLDSSCLRHTIDSTYNKVQSTNEDNNNDNTIKSLNILDTRIVLINKQ